MNKLLRQAREKAGRRAETLAAWYLRFKGYKILAQRYKTKYGEVDLAARSGKSLVFVEVKYRAFQAAAQDIIGYGSEKRIMDAAEVFLTRNSKLCQAGYEIRFDVIYVIGRWKITHIRDAFRGY